MNCVLTHLDWTIRHDSNMAEFFALNPWRDDKLYYIIRLLYRDLYFLTIVIVMIAVFFILILDNFNELRANIDEKNKDMNNICFICGASRDEKEKGSINFNSHITSEHNIWNYSEFLICLQFMDIQDTNAVQSYVIECFNNRSIICFPMSEV